MAEANSPRVITLDGRTPFRSNVSAHSSDETVFVEFQDVTVDGKARIRKRPGTGAQIGSAMSGDVTAVHEFEHVNPSTGVSALFRFRAGGTTIQRESGGIWSTETLPVTLTSGGKFVFLNFKNRCFVCNGKDDLLVFDGTSWRVAGVDPPASAAAYTFSGASVPSNERPYSTGTVGVNAGSTSVTGTGTTWVTSGAWSNRTIFIDGKRYEIDNVSGTNALDLTETWKGDTTSGLTYVIYPGLMDWDLPPRYSWAYYNPNTGHISNVAPVTEIVEQNQVGRTIQLTMAATAAHQTAYAAGYTEIKIFRTLKNGYTLLMVDDTIANVNSAVTDIVWTESSTTYKDVHLTDFTAPDITNVKPPKGISSIVEWQGRIWYIRPTDIGGSAPYEPPSVGFSLVPLETPIGRPEECMPARFRRFIHNPTGLVGIASNSVNDGIVIQTTKGDYTLMGYNNLTITDPFYMETRKQGGWQGSAIDVRGNLVQFYRDKRLIDYGLNTDIGFPLQDKLKELRDSTITDVYLCWFSYEEKDYLLLTGVDAAAAGRTYVFDYDQQQWYQWNFSFLSAGTIRDASTGELELWIGRIGGRVFQLLQDGEWQDAAVNFQPTLKTSHVKPFGDGVYGALVEIKIWVGPVASSPENETWQLKYFTEEDMTGTSVNFAQKGHLSQSAQNRELSWSPHKPIVSQIFQFEITFPSTATELHIERIQLVFERDQVEVVRS